MIFSQFKKTRRITILLFIFAALYAISFYEFSSSYEQSEPKFLLNIKWLISNPECSLEASSGHEIIPDQNDAKTATLTLWDQNIWAGIFTRKPMKRIRHLVDAVKNRQIITLQELFTTQAIRFPEFASHPYFDYPGKNKGFLPERTGLAILSKLKILEIKYFLYSEEAGTDTLANKGVFLARIKHPELGILDVYTTHLQSPFMGTKAAIRQSQVKELINFIKANSTDNLVILTGDFNFSEWDPLFKELTQSLNLMDVMRVMHPDKANNLLITYPSSYSRLDYIFVRNSKKWSWDAKKSNSAIIDLNLSDHLGLCAKLVYTEN